MEESDNKRLLATVAVSVPTFQQRLNRIIDDQGKAGTGVLSQLALVHQTAKEFAVEAAAKKDVSATSVDIEELTNPPLFDFYPEEEPVVIHYSYKLSAD